jgi:hypothetical protein
VLRICRKEFNFISRRVHLLPTSSGASTNVARRLESVKRQLQRSVWSAGWIAAMAFVGSQANAACTFGTSSEPSLQASFDTLLGAGAINAATACVAEPDDNIWNFPPYNGITTEINFVLELGGPSPTSTLGIYDLNDPNRRLSIFEAGDTAGAVAAVSLHHTADGWRFGVQRGRFGQGSWTYQIFSDSAFGFYLATAAQGTFFSQTSRNDDGVDHLYAYAGTGTHFLDGPFRGYMFSRDSYLFAWEGGDGDGDFQDVVAMMGAVHPVPLPAPIVLLISGLLGLAGTARRANKDSER